MENETNVADTGIVEDKPAETAVPESTPTPAAVDQNPDGSAAPTETPKPAVDPNAEILTRLDSITKSYKELQGFSTRTAQEKADLRKQLAELHKAQQETAAALAKAFEKPHDPDQFMEELRTQGPAYVQKHVQKLLDEANKKSASELSEARNAMAELRYDYERDKRVLDTKRYPDYEKLEAEMNEVASSETCPVDLSKSTGAVLDALYEFVKARHSKEAILAAAKSGRADADAERSREAATTVAAGGKNTGPSHKRIEDMTSEEIKKSGLIPIADY